METNWLNEGLPSVEEVLSNPEAREKLQARVREGVLAVLQHILLPYEVMVQVAILSPELPLTLNHGACHFVVVHGPKQGVQAFQWSNEEETHKGRESMAVEKINKIIADSPL